MLKKPPLGCIPTKLILAEQINRLSEAIYNYTNGRTPNDNEIQKIEQWNKEINMLAETISKL